MTRLALDARRGRSQRPRRASGRDTAPSTRVGEGLRALDARRGGTPRLSRYDLWSLGVVLYHLATGRPLWKTDVHDDVVPRDLKKLAKGEARKLMADFQRAVGRNASQDQLTAKDLVAKLLEPNAKRRLDEDHLPDMQAVLQKHPFLQTKDLNDATLATIKAQNDRILEGVDALRDLSGQNSVYTTAYVAL